MRRMNLAAAIVLVMLVGFAVKARAEEEGFQPLFNGRDLTGWNVVNGAPSTWSVRDGAIVTTGLPTGFLRSDKMYENFILELEWKHITPGGNAGIFVFSGDLPVVSQPFAKAIEVQVLDGLEAPGKYTSHGDVFAIQGATMVPVRPHPQGWMRCLPSEMRSNPAGQWNHYRIVCQDGTVTLFVNGKEVSGGRDCSQRRGYICLESEGSECHYRNLKIKELPGTQLRPDQISQAARGFKTIYTGVDLSGWKQVPEQPGIWSVKDWTLACKGTGGSASEPNTLWTEKEYGDFQMIVDWRLLGKKEKRKIPLDHPDGGYGLEADGKTPQTLEIEDAGEGGICLRGDGKRPIKFWCHPYGSGEVEACLHDMSLPVEVRRQMFPKLKADYSLGKFNRFTITMRGDKLTVLLNDKLVIDNAPFQGIAPRGPIGLQCEGAPLEFANVFIRELGKGE